MCFALVYLPPYTSTHPADYSHTGMCVRTGCTGVSPRSRGDVYYYYRPAYRHGSNLYILNVVHTPWRDWGRLLNFSPAESRSYYTTPHFFFNHRMNYYDLVILTVSERRRVWENQAGELRGIQGDPHRYMF